MKTNVKAICSSCGEATEVPVYSGINTAQEPELKQKVKNGSLFLWECPHCGTANLAAGQTIYHDPAEKLMIWLLPQGSLPEERVVAVEKSLLDASEALEGYTFRRVEDAGTLIEKVNIFDAGLDDLCVEMCKYITKMELSGKDAADSEAAEASLKFFRIDGPDNDITFSYPAKDGMRMIQVGFNVYEDCAGIIRRNPSMKPPVGFSRIDQEWISRFFK